MKKLIVALILLSTLGISKAEAQSTSFFFWRYRTATSCQALTNGVPTDLCSQPANNELWGCQPANGQTCVQPSDWIQLGSVSTNSVTSVGASAGLVSSGGTTPIIGIASGQYLPTTADQTNWNLAYTNRLTSVTTTSPLTFILNNGALNGSISQATSTSNGYLDSTDWNTFFNKQNALGYTAENTANKSTNQALGTSNTLYPTQDAVYVYVNNGLAGKQASLTGSISGTANEVIVGSNSNSVASNFTLSLPQAIATSSSPTFAGLTLGSLSGVLQATAGVISGNATLNNLAAPTANFSMNSFNLTNLLNPVNPQDAATKSYVDSAAAGLQPKLIAQEATVTTLPANTYNNGTSGVGATLTANADGTLTIDGIAVALNDRVLVQNESAGANNGIYSLTTLGDGSHEYVLTRTTDANTGTLLKGAYLYIAKGTANAGLSFVNTNSSTITVGTTAVTFAEFSSTVSVTASSPLAISGNNLTIQNAAADGATKGAASFTSTDFTASSGNISINYASAQHATTSQNGFLDSTDWSTFNNKEGTALNSGDVWIGNSSNVATPTVLSGDATMTNSGVVTISTGAVTLPKMANETNNTMLGNVTGSAATPTALTASQILTFLALNNVQNININTWAGSSNLITLGTVTTGVWDGSVIGVTYGGNGSAPASSDEVNVSLSTSTAAWKAIGSCSTANSAVTYNTTTHAFGCNTISGSIGGSSTQVLYNNAGVVGGITNATTNGTTLTLTSPKVVTDILDTNGNDWLGVTATASAVDQLTLSDSATGTNPVISATGSDTNIGITLTPKGTGTVVIGGSTSSINGDGTHNLNISGNGHTITLGDGGVTNYLNISTTGVLSFLGTAGIELPYGVYASRPSSPVTGQEYVVDDATSAGVCTAGGGSSLSLCAWNGTAWAALGGGSGGGGSGVINSASAGQIPWYAATGTTLSGITDMAYSATRNSSSGITNMLALTPTWTQTSTAGYIGLLINATESSVGSGNKYLMDLQTGGTNEFYVTDAGNAVLNGSLTTGGTGQNILNYGLALNNGGNTSANGGDFTFKNSSGTTIFSLSATNSTISTGITGSTQCLEVNSSGTVIGTGSSCGSGGSAPMTLTGSTNAVQLLVIGNATQTANILAVENSASTVEAAVDNSGDLTLNGTVTTGGTGQSNTGYGLIVNSGGNTTSAGGDFAFKNSSGTTIFTLGATSGVATLNSMTGTSCLEEVSGVITATGSACGSGGGGASAPLTLTGSTNAVQLLVIGNATQTANLFALENSGSTVETSVDNSGDMTLNGTLTTGGTGQSNTGYGLIVNSGGNSTSSGGDFSFKNSSGTTVFTLGATTGLVNTYNAVSTVGAGIPPEVATEDLTSQGAAISATTIYTTPSGGAAGMYEISYVTSITTAASSSSILGGVQVLYTDNDDSNVKTTVAGPTSTANTVGTTLSGVIVVWAKNSSNIQMLTGYTSVGGTAMKYNLHYKVKYLG